MAVALKIDEAPLVLNRGFAETMALKRSAGLETVACWQTDAQWVGPRGARPARRAVRPPRLLRHRLGPRRPCGGRADDGRVLRQRPAGTRAPLGARTPRRAPAPAQAPRDRQLDAPPRAARRRSSRRRSRCAVDPERIARIAAAQAERGGRQLTDLAPAALGRAAAPRPGAASADAAAGAPGRSPAGVRDVSAPADRRDRPRRAPPLPDPSAAELPGAGSSSTAPQRVRRVPAAGSPDSDFEPERLDLEMLALIGRLAHVLSSQIHRRFNPRPGRHHDAAAAQALSDAGLSSACSSTAATAAACRCATAHRRRVDAALGQPATARPRRLPRAT